MPARSNEFQRLIFLVKEQLAGTTSVVTESRFLPHRDTGEREVDIVIETKVAGHTFMASVECTKTGRKASVGWVEEMLAKHQGLPTNLLVLASTGFTSGAIKVAAANRIELLSF